jgi:uncharacterized Zn finger protein
VLVPGLDGHVQHVAAVLSGVGVRLDERPALFFTLRQVDETELLRSVTSAAVPRTHRTAEKRIAADKLADAFGIEIEDEPPACTRRPQSARRAVRTRAVPT